MEIFLNIIDEVVLAAMFIMGFLIGIVYGIGIQIKKEKRYREVPNE